MKNRKTDRVALPLTEREHRVLAYIARCIDTTGCQPSYRQIGAYFKWSSVNSVACLLINCVAKGEVWKTSSRGIHFDWRKYL